MEEIEYLLTAQQYRQLYIRAFARLEDVARQAERAMAELEELQLSMAEEPAAAPGPVLPFSPGPPASSRPEE